MCKKASPLAILARIGLCLGVLAATIVGAEGETQPRINWIQINTNLSLVLLHFDTDANRSYAIQYIDYAPTNGATWSLLASVPVSAAPGHYVWPDSWSPTRRQRFYRLQAAP